MQRGTFQMMKSVNKSIILNKIRTMQPISRAQIAKSTKLTPPTVSTIVKELIEQEIVIETILGESQGGRKPTMLQINHSRYFAIGLDVGPNSLKCLLTDLSGKTLSKMTSSFTNELHEQQFVNMLKESIYEMLKKVTDKESVVGIGVAMHGVVNIEEGIALYAPNLNLNDIPIKEILEAEFDLIVKVENDARAMALGESWFGNYDASESMLVINFGNGVGAGVVVNGHLYHGANDLAGEVGHMVIDIHGDVCECGNKGCLQALTSGSAIVQRAYQITQDETLKSGEDVYKRALDGDINCIKALEETGELIGIGLTNLIHIINPDLIVLGGGVIQAKQFILPTLKQEIQTRGLTKAAQSTKIITSTLGENATLLGAISLLLVDIFEPL